MDSRSSLKPTNLKIKSIFEKAQSPLRHRVLAEKCKKLYKKYSTTKFLEAFKTAVRYALVYADDKIVNSILSFVARVVVLIYTIESDQDDFDGSDTLTENCTFPNAILELIFKTHEASLAKARKRCLQLLNKILSGMPENSTISDNIWVKLKKIVLTRIQDTSSGVRVQAVLTARKLQDPKNPNCEIIKAFLFHLNDPSSCVRCKIVSSIAFNKLTIGHVLARTRDVDENVRRNTYIVFSKIKVLNLTIKYRLTILERGLQDRSAAVKFCCQSILLVNWLEDFKRDIVKFLEALDVVNCSDIALMVVENIFKIQSMKEILKFLPLDEESRLIPAEKLTPETALVWRAVAQYFYKENEEEELEKVLPNITVFCDYIRGMYSLEKNRSLNLSHDEKWEEIKEKETLKHLLELMKFFDFADELGRLNLKKLLFDMLVSDRIDNDKIKCVVELIASVIPNQEMFLQELTEIISELREPLVVETVNLPRHKQLEIEINISNLKVTLNDLREREYNAVSYKNYSEAESIKAEIERIETEIKDLSDKMCVSMEVREEKNDPVTICKCLTIVFQMIIHSKVRMLTPSLQNIKENFLNQYLKSQDLLTQSLCVQVLGQFCILDVDLAKKNLVRFFIMLSESGEDEINGPALKSIFDILQCHGLKTFKNLDFCEENENEVEPVQYEDLFICEVEGVSEGMKFMPILVELLNCKSNDMLKSITFEGLCKLFLSGDIYSSTILENVILKGFSPIIDNESEDYIRQVFMVFFPIFASSTPRSQKMIEYAFLPILRTLLSASPETPEASINPKDVASFLIEYTRPNINKHTPTSLHVHNNLAISICHEILERTSEEESSEFYFKILLQLKLSFREEAFVNQLQNLSNKIKKVSKEKKLLHYLRKLNIEIEENCRNSLTSIENTLKEETVTDADEESVSRSGRNIQDENAEETVEKSEDSSNDSSDNIFQESSTTNNRKNYNFVPESPDISE